jgi:hypothetical protein
MPTLYQSAEFEFASFSMLRHDEGLISESHFSGKGRSFSQKMHFLNFSQKTVVKELRCKPLTGVMCQSNKLGEYI